MSEEDFKKMCPNLLNAIKANEYTDEIYGIKFKTHTRLTYWQIKERVEDPRAFILWSPKILNEPVLIVFN